MCDFVFQIHECDDGYDEYRCPHPTVTFPKPILNYVEIGMETVHIMMTILVCMLLVYGLVRIRRRRRGNASELDVQAEEGVAYLEM